MSIAMEQEDSAAREESPVSDVTLLQRYAKHGDREALGLFFSRHANEAYRTAYRIMRNVTDAEDAVQSAFVRIMRDAAGYRGGEGVRMWIMRIVMSTCRDAIRKNVRRRRHEDEKVNIEEPENTEDSIEMVDRVKRLLDVLPERYRMPVWLHHCEGLPFRDIAFALAVPEGTARSYATRGLDMLRDRLGHRGIAVPVSGIVAALVALPAEHASANLMDRIEDLATNGASATVAGGSSAATAGAVTVWKWLSIAGGAGILIVGLVAVNALRSRLLMSPTASALPSPAIAPAVPGVHYYWALNSPSLPPELKLLQGKATHLPEDGVNGSGCLLIQSSFFLCLIDVPMDRLPVVLSYRISPRNVANQGLIGYNTLSCWSEIKNTAQFEGLGAWHPLPTPAALDEKPWILHREYVTEEFIYRWQERSHYGLGVYERVPNARLALGGNSVPGELLIDDIRIESVRAEDIPDASPYLRVLASIPASHRKGTIALPQLKSNRPDKGVSVRFGGHFSILD